MRIAAAFATLCMVAPVCALAQDHPPPPAPIEAWTFEKMEVMGRAIWRQDRAAIAASELLHRRFPDGGPPGLAGWIVIEDGEAQRVRFIRDDGSGPRAGWDVTVRDRRAGPLVEPAESTLSPDELAQYRARMTAARDVPPMRCGLLNSVVIRDPESDDWLVWLLATANDARTIPYSGNFRFRISADGRTVLRRDQLFTHCYGHPRSPSIMQETLTLASGVPPSEVIVFLSLENRHEIAIEDSPTSFAVFCRGEIQQVFPPERHTNSCRRRTGRVR